jgi:prevent-host-death family protein
MQVTEHAAKIGLSKLIEKALSGEDVVITRDGKPVAKLVAIRDRTFKFGLLKNQLKGPIPDFLEPMDEADLAAWEGSGTETRGHLPISPRR